MKLTKFKPLALLSLLLFISINVSAQIGPELPNCPECDNIASRALPKNTIYWNPDQSGVGINIEVQGDRVFGIYYGYDNDGKSTWYTFVGDLIASENPESTWEVAAPLLTFENGKCINCDHQFPEVTNFTANIHIRFNQSNHASYTIDDGEVQNIVPFVFGNQVKTAFPEQTSLEIPDLQGTWVFSFIDLPVHEFHPIQAGVYHLSGGFARDLNGYRLLDVSGHYTDVVFSVLQCRTFTSNDTVAGPICSLFGEINDDGTSDGYLLNIGDIGTNKMIGRKANGDTIEAYKLEFGQY